MDNVLEPGSGGGGSGAWKVHDASPVVVLLGAGGSGRCPAHVESSALSLDAIVAVSSKVQNKSPICESTSYLPYRRLKFAYRFSLE